MSDIEVKTRAGFNNQGKYAKRGSTITVTEARAKELLRNGLIEDWDVDKSTDQPESKQATKPKSKAATKPSNKAASQPENK